MKKQYINKMMFTFLVVFCLTNLATIYAQTPVPGTRYCLRNSSVAQSTEEEINGEVSLTADGKVRSEIFGGTNLQRAEARLARVDPGDRFGFGVEISGLSGAGGKVWQIIGPPYNGNALAMSVGNNGNLVIEQAARPLLDLGSPSGSNRWYFKIHAARSGSIEVYKNGVRLSAFNGDLNLGQSNSGLRLGRYTRLRGAAIGYYDKMFLDGLQPVTEYTTGSCGQTSTPPSNGVLSIAGVTASSSDGNNTPTNTFDNNLVTRWAVQGDGQYILYDLGTAATVTDVEIAWYRGNQRQARFEVEVSNDASSWTQVFAGESNGETTALERFSLADRAARYVRIVGRGNTQNNWTSITEARIFGRR